MDISVCMNDVILADVTCQIEKCDMPNREILRVYVDKKDFMQDQLLSEYLSTVALLQSDPVNNENNIRKIPLAHLDLDI